MHFSWLLYLAKSLPILFLDEVTWHQVLDYSDRKIESPLSRSCEELLLGPCLLFRPPLSISLVIIHNLSAKLDPLLFTTSSHMRVKVSMFCRKTVPSSPSATKGGFSTTSPASVAPVCTPITILPLLFDNSFEIRLQHCTCLFQSYMWRNMTMLMISYVPAVCTNPLSGDSSNRSAAMKRFWKRSLSRKNSCPATLYSSKWSEPHSACKGSPS